MLPFSLLWIQSCLKWGLCRLGSDEVEAVLPFITYSNSILYPSKLLSELPVLQNRWALVLFKKRINLTLSLLLISLLKKREKCFVVHLFFINIPYLSDDIASTTINFSFLIIFSYEHDSHIMINHNILW